MRPVDVIRFALIVGIAASLVVGRPSSGRAEEEVQTKEVVVSATKTEIPVKQVTSAVEIITGEQLQQRKVKTVAEALRLAQGLAVFQSGGPGTIVDVRMRGGTPEQTHRLCRARTRRWRRVRQAARRSPTKLQFQR